MAAPGASEDPTDLHALAVDAQTDIQRLATGLAHAGAAPQAVATLTHMALVISQVIKILAQGPAGGQGEAQPGGPPQGQPAQQAPQQAQPAQQAPPAQAAQQHSLHSAAHSLHAAMQATAPRQQPQQP